MLSETAGRNEAYAQQLLGELQRQALTGGTKKKVQVIDITGEVAGGPYWQTETWNTRCSAYVNLLVKECGYSQQEADQAVKTHSKGVILW